MEFEHCEKQIVLDEHLEAELQKLATEGWGLVPGTKPVATYQLVRVKPGHGMGGELRLGIDDSKIGILRNGKLVPQ